MKINKLILFIFIGSMPFLTECRKFPAQDDNCIGDCLIFTGNIRDDSTGLPLSDVNVKLFEATGIFLHAKAETYSDDLGDYRFSVEREEFDEENKARIDFTKENYLRKSEYLSYSELINSQEKFKNVYLQQTGNVVIYFTVTNKKIKRLYVEIQGIANSKKNTYDLSKVTFPWYKTYGMQLLANRNATIYIKTSTNKSDLFGSNWEYIDGYPSQIKVAHQENQVFNVVIN